MTRNGMLAPFALKVQLLAKRLPRRRHGNLDEALSLSDETPVPAAGMFLEQISWYPGAAILIT